MKVLIANLDGSGEYIDATQLALDAIGAESLNEMNAVEAQEAGFEIARNSFGTDNVDCGVV